jgi:Flp pilus assembly protein CpaB
MADAAAALQQPTAPVNGQREINRRRRLPGGRALVGGFLVAASAVGLFAAFLAATAGPQHSYVVAARDLEVGERLALGDLSTTPMVLSDALHARVFSDPEALLGTTVVARRSAGELVHASDLVRADGEPATRELSFSVEASRALGDRLRPGEHVDVIATFGSGRDAYSVLVISDARVLRAHAAAGGLMGDGRLHLALELASAEDVLALAHAVDVGQVTVVRATGADPRPPGETYRPEARAPGADPEAG